MTPRHYLFILAAASLAGWGTFGLVVLRLDPCTAPGEITICRSVAVLSQLVFYPALFFALAATFTLLGFAMRMWSRSGEMYTDDFSVSLRQGILLSLTSLAALVLLLLKILTWWSGLLLLGVVLLVEVSTGRS